MQINLLKTYKNPSIHQPLMLLNVLLLYLNFQDSKKAGMQFTKSIKLNLQSKKLSLINFILLLINHNFKRALIQFKKEKSVTLTEFTSLQGSVLQDFMKTLKFEVEKQITSKPQDTESIRQEEKAILHLWKTQKDFWVEQGKKTAQDMFNNGPLRKKARTESSHLEEANVSQTHYPNTHSNLYESSEISESSTSQEKIHSLSQTQQRTRDQTRQVSQEVPKEKRVRRLPRYKKNCIKDLENKIHEFQLECQEYDLAKDNIKRLGVSQTQVHNISGIDIPHKEIESLALGIKFIPIPKIRPNTIEEACNAFEKTIRWKTIFKDEDSEIPAYWRPSDKIPQRSTPEIELALSKLRREITHNTKNFKRNMTPTHFQNLNNLLKRPNILVITADKNLGYTIVSTDWYRLACLEHLESDAYIECTDKFMKLDNGHTSIIELKENLKELITENSILLGESETKWIMQPQDYKLMKFYILAKIHKNPIKGRPIVPSMTWITHHLSQWIAFQLNPLISNLEWVLKDSRELLKEIHNINSKKELKKSSLLPFIYSADVEALYPNMDVQLGLKLTKEFLTEINWETSQHIDFIIKAMHFVLTQGFIIFENRVFQQRNGAAMGSPMIPPYANIYMYMLERTTIHKYLKSGNLKLYRRYIDDVLLIIQSQNDKIILELQAELNNIHPKIRLTWTNQSQTCNFLDLTLWITPKNHIQSNVFQKPLNIYAYLPYHSYHTESQKKGFIKAEALRYARTCSRKQDFNNIMELFKVRLQRRGYPLDIIHQSIKNVFWEDRLKYLFKSTKTKNKLPLLYKILYSPAHNHKQLRKSLDRFTSRMKQISAAPRAIQQKITICYKLPSKLHNHILKNRKTKGF